MTIDWAIIVNRFRIFFLALAMFVLGSSQVDVIAQDTLIPEAMPLVDEEDYDIVNFLLIGSATYDSPNNPGLTDTLILVSVNRTAGTVSLLSIPRDLYVYIPGWRMHKINTAYFHAENSGLEGGGISLLRETIRYNLGFEIDFYARVDFNGFMQIIDALGGLDLSVDCAIQDWRLIEPGMDPRIEDNWEMFTLPMGVHRMNGDLALWYVRSRRSSNELDRGRRQQDVIRALWRHIRSQGLLDQLPNIWGQVTQIVDTDITLPDLVGLIPLALTIDTSRLQSYRFREGIEIVAGESDEGSFIFNPQREAIIEMAHLTVQPPTERQLVTEQAAIEIVNASNIVDLAQVAADRIASEGFVPRIVDEPQPLQDATVIYDYTGQTKGSSIQILQSALRLGISDVIFEPDPNRTVDFRIVIGASYARNSCTFNVRPPIETEG
jgi:polyisoprenyl-teichoic acid--peptidoglycan teichoic acid transferase